MNIYDKNFVENSPYEWSNDFSIKSIGISNFNLKKKSDTIENYKIGNETTLFVKVETQLVNGIFYVRFSQSS